MRAFASRHLREWALLLALLLAALVLAVRGGWFDRVDYWLYDSSVALSGRPASPDIVILAIDEASVAGLGRWPWSRRLLAQTLERLVDAGSGPILLDLILAEPERDDPGADARLSAALARHGRVVLPVFMPSPAAPAIVPLSVFADHARLGHAQALVDADGVSRRYLPWERGAGAGYVHVAHALHAVAGGQALATGDGAARAVPFAGPPGHFTRISVLDLLQGRVEPGRLRGKTVLLGATATGLGDNLVTPLAGAGGTMPGVEFVANIVDGLRSSAHVRNAEPAVRLTVSVLLVCALLVVLLLSSPRVALGATVGAVLACGLFAWLMFAQCGWWWPPAAPMVMMALAYPLWSWRRLESSLGTMARETARIATLARPGGVPARQRAETHFLDPVEARIAAISQAVDRIAEAVVVDDDGVESRHYREDMMRHLAHDLRSPLVSLRSLADQLRSDRGAGHAAMLERIDACARRSLDLTEQFLLLGRAQALDAQQFAEVDLVQLLHQCADDLWEDAQRVGGRIERRCALDVALVRGDARLLQRAVLNLGWNALRHGPAGGVVTLSLESASDGFMLTVHDQGPGFAPEQLADLTRRYAQGARAGQGHGLGLALVRLVAQKHGASVSVSHPPEGGFGISLRLESLA